ncbi:MAG: IS200/IS605 family transposase [Candidatus Electrothrix sp. GM3_4]|nr:IS200/IS605 family transposase [Candidatus Electrothrix sp. GM3_4]
MPQSLAKIYLHLIFSTKDRMPFLVDKKVREETHAYLFGACREFGVPPVIVGGVADHVHLACSMSRTLTVADLVRDIKRTSSNWLKHQSEDTVNFHWQSGYGVFSVSPSHVDALKEYILRQEKHHRDFSFQDEFRHIAQKYGVEYDERYMWD